MVNLFRKATQKATEAAHGAIGVVKDVKHFGTNVVRNTAEVNKQNKCVCGQHDIAMVIKNLLRKIKKEC
tara:strand:+ start:2036 stop:2242 length:207 start_codon:yes stop_codon:yes gene_type:complete